MDFVSMGWGMVGMVITLAGWMWFARKRRASYGKATIEVGRTQSGVAIRFTPDADTAGNPGVIVMNPVSAIQMAGIIVDIAEEILNERVST